MDEDKEKFEIIEPSFYAVVPFEIIANKELTYGSRLLYAVLSSLCRYKGYCWASNAYLASIFDTTKTTISTWLGSLEKNNLIKIELDKYDSDNCKRRIFLTIMGRGGIKKNLNTPLKNFKYPNNNNYTSYNSIIIDKYKQIVGGSPTRCAKSKISSFDEKYVHLFIETLLSKRKIFNKINKNLWIREFQELRRQVGKKRLKKILLWYCGHLQDKFCPKAYSMKTFKTKFFQIEDAMDRDRSISPVEKPPIPCDLAIKLSRGLLDMGWTHTTRDRLANAISESLAKYDKFLRTIRSFIKNNSDNKFYEFARYFYNKLHLKSEFIRKWFEDVHKQLKNWQNWNGDIEMFIFDPNSKQFEKICRNISNEYCGNPDRWDKFKKVLKDL